MIDGKCIFYEIALRQMSVDLTDDKSALVQVMGQWLGVIRQQAITQANVDPDLCCHIWHH